jgi:hypothetical protein
MHVRAQLCLCVCMCSLTVLYYAVDNVDKPLLIHLKQQHYAMALPSSDVQVRIISSKVCKQPSFIWFITAENVLMYAADKFILILI